MAPLSLSVGPTLFYKGTNKIIVYFNPVNTMARNPFETLSPDSIRAATHDELIRGAKNVWFREDHTLGTY